MDAWPLRQGEVATEGESQRFESDLLDIRRNILALEAIEIANKKSARDRIHEDFLPSNLSAGKARQISTSRKSILSNLGINEYF